MRRMKLALFLVGIMVVSTFAAGVSAAALQVGTTKADAVIVEVEKVLDPSTPEHSFYAEITIYVYEGTGCACEPIPEADVWAFGLDIGHNDTNLTDAEGYCTLHLEVNFNYRVTIEKEGFQTIRFDLLVVDDQTFVFHLQEEEPIVSRWSAVFQSCYHFLIARLPSKLLSTSWFSGLA
jgi:hypothetical protein